MLTLEYYRWMEEPIQITSCLFPVSEIRFWQNKMRDDTLPNVFRLIGLVSFENLEDDASELVPCILGDDLNIDKIFLNNDMKNFQSFNDDKVRVQTVGFGSLTMCRGDVVMTQHMTTFPTSSHIGVDDCCYCDTRKKRVVISELTIDKTGWSDATESDGVQDDLANRHLKFCVERVLCDHFHGKSIQFVFLVITSRYYPRYLESRSMTKCCGVNTCLRVWKSSHYQDRLVSQATKTHHVSNTSVTKFKHQ